jgi:hypothetical protein
MLAKALGMIPRTIQRGLQELAQAGWFTRKLTRGAPYYSFAFDRMLKEGHTLSPLNGTDGETDQAGWGDKSVAMARHTLSHGTEKNRELKEKRKSDASPSPHNGASVAGPWKPFDPPPESRVSEEERKANLAKLKNVFRHKQGG